jgi:tetratricopeptide (TPR) repeat protein
MHLPRTRATGGEGPPDLLVYRRDEDPKIPLKDEQRRTEQIRQFEALSKFWQRWFKRDDQILAAFSEYKSLDEFDRKFEADLSKLMQRYIRQHQLHRAPPLWIKGSPFRGLDAYEFEHAPIFFGRDREITKGLSLLSAAAERGTAFLVVSGASGSGKSSLARAGLLPSLVAAKAVPGIGLWRHVVMRPADAGGDSILGLTRALVFGNPLTAEGLPELAGPHVTVDQLTDHLRRSGDPAFMFAKTLKDLADAERHRKAMLPHERARLVILVDQLEELFTRPEILAAERTAFAELLSLLARSGVVWVIATMRSDFWHRGLEIPALRDLIHQGAYLELFAPDAAQLLEMIRQPAEAAGLSFDGDSETGLRLDALVAKDAGSEPGSLPLLSVMLEDIYKRDVKEGATGGVLTVASYRALGGLREAIGQRAENVLRRLQNSDPDAAKALPSLLRRLITTDLASGVIGARAMPIANVDKASPEGTLIQAFLADEARLLIAEDRGSGPEVRLAHEALVENWPRAKAWVEENRRDIEAEALLNALKRIYDVSPEPSRYRNLLFGTHLELGFQLIARGAISETSDLGRFITESAKDQDRIEYYRRKANIEAAQQRWEESGRSSELLIAPGIPLVEAQFIVAKYGHELETTTREFIAASQQRAIRRQQRVALAAVFFGCLAVIASGVGIWANRERLAAVAASLLAEQTAERVVFDIAQGLRDVEGMRAETVRKILGTAAMTVDALVGSAPENLELQRTRSAMLNEFGDTYLRLGDRAQALKSYRDGLVIAERLAKANPNNTRWQRDLSVSYDKIGDVLQAHDNLGEALKYYRDSLAIAERLSKADPAKTGWQHDLSLSYVKIGDVSRAQGNLGEALKLYRDSLAILEGLVKVDPGNMQWQRDLSVSYSRVGDVLLARGDLGEALKSYRDSLGIREPLAKRNPDNTQWQRDRSIAYEKIGDALGAQGDLGEALKSYRDSLGIRERLAKSDPGNTQWGRDLAVSYDKIGKVMVDQGDLEEALRSYHDSLAIFERLAKIDPSNTQWQSELSWSYMKVGEVLEAQRNLGEALKSYRDSLAIWERLTADDPRNLQWQRDLQSWAEKVGGLAYRFVLAGDFARGLECADQAISMAPEKIWLYANRAHALMFLERVEEARVLYLQYRGARNVYDNKTWEDIVLEDFAELRKSGLTRPLMDEIEKLLAAK